MKVLIVGGSGYVGGYLTDYLLNNGYMVTVYDALVYESRFLKNVPFIYGDIRDRDKLSKIINEYDIIVWLAAVVGDGACAVDPFLTQSINEDSVKWLIDNYHGKIIFPSTCSVYGINDELLDENSDLNPLSIYAKTKLAAEQYIINNYHDYLIFRLGTLYGVGDEHSRIRLDLVVNVLTKKAALGEKLVVNGGEQWRPLLHVRDVATAINFGLNNQMRGLYNLGSGNYKIIDIAMCIKSIIPGCDIELVDGTFEDLRNYRISAEKFLGYGWVPQYVMDDGIKQITKLIGDKRLKNVQDPIYSNEGFLNTYYSKL